jgi:hypothetical protein
MFMPRTRTSGTLGSLMLGAALLLNSSPGRAGGVTIAESTFDSKTTKLDGWTSTTNEVTWDDGSTHSGGNPGGFAYFQENGSANSMAEYMIAPKKFLTAGGVNWAALNGNGVISFDHKIIAEMNEIMPYSHYQIQLSGPNDSAIWTGPIATANGWESVSAKLIQADWDVTSGTWTGLLSDVTNFQILMEVARNDDTSSSIDEEGIDNIRLSAVPEPTGATLTAVSLVAVSMAAWRRRKCQRLAVAC